MSISVIIGYGMNQSIKMMGTFRLHELTERVSHLEETEQFKHNRKQVDIQVVKNKNKVLGEATINGNRIQIEKTYFDPEEWIRMLTLFTQQE